ncbi:MAG TPA: hypothetical protein VJG30_00500 [Candidatus Nanoarchaeia archaeon]|nr:hypothetical protein [Candidatus Nanoarchaeia archaeon]
MVKELPPEIIVRLADRYHNDPAIARDVSRLAESEGLDPETVYAYTTALEDGFVTPSEFSSYLRMKRGMERRARRMLHKFKEIGYDIKSLSNGIYPRSLDITLAEDENVDSDLLQGDFARHSHACAGMIEVMLGFDAYKTTINRRIVSLEPQSLEARAFLPAYINILGTEIEDE